jgi:selenide,water dikinase
VTTHDIREHPPLSLTDRTECGGCAAKMGAGLLADAIAGLADHAPEDLIVGLHPPDDAAVYRVTDEIAVVGTVDFFPPVVDDPVAYGSIAAANAVSDVFAMGGRVAFALAVAALPEDLPAETTRAIFRGAAETVREAGGILTGGHTVRDAEPKYGLAVVGFVHPDQLLRKGGARPGDQLLLTKPLGTGLLISGDRRGETRPEWLEAAIASMRRLNRAAADVAVGAGLRAATDVTGFGLIGHSIEVARASQARLVIEAHRLPALPGALELAESGIETDGAAHNRRFAAEAVDVQDARPELVSLAFDPQTSGGLLLAVPPSVFDQTCEALDGAGVTVAHIGRVEAGAGVRLTV